MPRILHQLLTPIQSTAGYYNFSNIRYAQPPVGELRFRAPVAPSGRNITIDNGSIGRICPQANPAWYLIAAQFVPAYLTGQPFNLTAAEGALAGASSKLPPQDPRTTEDCLFLDVVVPQNIFKKATKESRNDDKKSNCGAPVLVWIYGGGYTAGEKTGFGTYNPAGLLKASQASGSEGVVYVALNYRLGAFGWISGPTLQSDGTANAGLYDQRLALQWIQKNIHLFGGDPNRVTVFGESAGGGSIFHQITAFGGLAGPAPFQQAVLQSAAWQNNPSNFQQELTAQSYLKLLNVSTIEEVRLLPSSALITANIIQVGGSAYGQFTYGPVVDGLFAPALPGKLLLQGSFDKNLKLLIGHNADEGLDFSSPAITNDTAYGQLVTTSYPDISPSAASYIENVLYPPDFSGKFGYKDEIGREVLTIADSSFTCTSNYLDRAFGNRTYAYEFSVPPALHGQDIPYTFFNGPNTAVKSDATAKALQAYITSFAETGVPSGSGIPVFPLYGNNSEILNLDATSITEKKDDTANARCLWWQKGLYY